MKKLMVAVCAAVFAVAANAAFVNWESGGLAALESCQGYQDYGMTGLGGGDAMSCVQMLVWESATQDYTDAASVWAAYQSGDLKAADAYVTTASLGNMGAPAVVGADTWTDKTPVYAAVLFLHSEDQDYANPDYYMANVTSANAATLGGQAINLGTVVGGGTGTTPLEWSAAAIPEPTSGLLLLLGVAGLALRRRRA